MVERSAFTITVVRIGEEFSADLYAKSEVNGGADLRLKGIGRTAREAVEICVTELESRAADGDETALRFA